ncbi:MAG: DUF4430 domain-containing protein [Candidatus Lokiarchaeota archaeon]|nr:DUF4430 domain-containing protein [Candidatus Lokiarchaeota archaeon]
MKTTKKTIYFISLLFFTLLLHSGSIPFTRAKQTISESYSPNLNFNKPYLYEVVQFGDSTGWYNFTFGFEGEWKTNPGGQIRINLTGSYNKDINDWGNVFSDPIPWYDIEIYKNNLGTLNNNFTLNNRSNSEVARALTLGYNDFQPGFLIPNENLTYIKELALNQSDPGGFYSKGDVNIEESYNFFYIGFEQIGGLEQKSYFIYDKWTGLLVWAKSSVLGYLLEIKSLNFTLEDNFIYNIIEFSGVTGWYNLTGGFEGDWNTNSGGQIIANLTGYYNKDPNDWGNVIDDPIPWFDIEIVENKTGILTSNFTIANRSNSELGWTFTLGYNYFQPGLLIQIIDNLTRVKKLALQEATGFANGLVSISETPLTIKIAFEQTDGEQDTNLIYEKRTGLLLWVYTSIGDYLLEMAIDDYTPWESTGEEARPPPNLFLSILPYIIIASISMLIITTSFITSRSKPGFKKFNKYILISVLAIASFTSFFVFTSSIEVGEVNTPLREVNDITLIVDYGNGTIVTWANFTLSDYNTTAFDALSEWCEVEITDYGERGIIVESINGLKKNWLYSVNDESPGVSAKKYNLRDGDIVEWTGG